jgi:hypothetical protein
MFKLMQRVWTWLSGGTFRLLLLAGCVLLLWGVLAPVGTIVWWLKQNQEMGLKQRSPLLPQKKRTISPKASTINCYIIYLPGVGEFSSDQLTSGEEWFLDRLARQHPHCVTVRDVFPYSVVNRDLNAERFLTPLWQWAKRADGWLNSASILIKIRNLWRFAISADDRYGRIYNRGMAMTIIDRMNAAHPLPRAQQPIEIILIGTSGGVQVALGATTYLERWVNAQLTVVSMGGTFNGENGFESVDRVYHLQGQRDWIEDLPAIVFPSRWPVTVGSPFNQARRQGRYTALSSGSHTHDGEQGYFGMANVYPGVSYVELTLQVVNQLPIW